MKKITILILTIIAIIAIIALVQNRNGGINTESKKVTSIIGKQANKTENGIKPCEIIKKHPFSRQDSEDTFKLKFNCENLEDSVTFQIIGFSGDLIYEQRFLGISFYDYGRPSYIYETDPKRGKDMNTQKLSGLVADSLQKADIMYIKNRMNDFFDEDRFMVNPMAKLDKKYLNVFQFDGISDDPTAIGFKIQLFLEGYEMIAFSKKMKKVQFIASAD